MRVYQFHHTDILIILVYTKIKRGLSSHYFMVSVGGLLLNFFHARRVSFSVLRTCQLHLLAIRSLPYRNPLNPETGFSPDQHNNFKTTTKVIVLKLSVGGLEPPQISPHAPQTCASTIPPHRHLVLVLDYRRFIILRCISNCFSNFPCHRIIHKDVLGSDFVLTRRTGRNPLLNFQFTEVL